MSAELDGLRGGRAVTNTRSGKHKPVISRRASPARDIYIHTVHRMATTRMPSPRTERVTGAVARIVKKRARQRAAALGVSLETLGAHCLAVELNMPEHDPLQALETDQEQCLLVLVERQDIDIGADEDVAMIRNAQIPLRVSAEVMRALTAHAAKLGMTESTVVAHSFAVELDMPAYDPYQHRLRSSKNQAQGVLPFAM